jgi:hypothetical protein
LKCNWHGGTFDIHILLIPPKDWEKHASGGCIDAITLFIVHTVSLAVVLMETFDGKLPCAELDSGSSETIVFLHRRECVFVFRRSAYDKAEAALRIAMNLSVVQSLEPAASSECYFFHANTFSSFFFWTLMEQYRHPWNPSEPTFDVGLTGSIC